LYCEESCVTVKKTVYSGNLQARFRFEKSPIVLSMKPSAAEDNYESAETSELVRFEAKTELPAWLTEIEYDFAENDDSLKNAELVIAAGRGVGKAENFQKLSELAEAMGGALGGTRPVVYDGKIPRERMIGSSAAVLAPKICIAFGASGAAPFLAGIEKSRLLIAVNRDPNALIFDNCDVGVVADCNEFAEALLQIYRKV
ncbi:MAG: FAD-binding protein, partial [Oscillospiraceae bacterium]